VNPLKNIFPKLFDYNDPASCVNALRRRRSRRFLALLETIRSELPIQILDVGGGYGYWAMTGLLDDSRYHITLLNLTPASLPTGKGGFSSLAGDATQLQFGDMAFDVVFSNSVIEHIPTRRGQQTMAAEVRRVGKRYFIQTPSKWFPLEPHSHLPLFQFFPRHLRALLIYLFNINWFPRARPFAACLEVADSIHMLSLGEMRALFPEAKIYKETLAGITKSYMAVDGWGENA
jgi:ubiquinone/menaquinone biosynthesis C-methylase UbiE